MQDPSLITKLERVHNEGTTTYKYLGVLLDENLSFDKHISYLCAKLSRSLFKITQVKNILPRKILLNLYHALIHPHFLYCLNIFSNTTQKNLDKLSKIQKKAIRTVCGEKYNAHTSNLFVKTGILPLHKLIIFQKASFMHSVYYNYCPKSFNELFLKKINNEDDHELRNYNNFLIPLPKTEWYKKMPPFSFPSTWNNLAEPKLYNNRFTFQHALKEQLFGDMQN